MSTNTKYLLIAVAAAAVIYFFFLKKKKHPAMGAHKPVAAAVKKSGGGGWRHRLSHVASGMAHTALASSGIPGAGVIGEVAGI